MVLGDFTFSTRADNLHGRERTSQGRHAPQELSGADPPVQTLGRKAQTVTLQILILPEYQGGLGQIEALHAAAGDGVERALCTGYGAYLGDFLIEKVREKDSYIVVAGAPRKIEATLDLIRQAEGAGGFFGLF